MFGMEDSKKGSQELLSFELEEDMQDPGKFRELKKKVEERVQTIKTALRGGADQEDFDQFGVVLHGYLALQKVITKVHKKVSGKK